jgi:type II secretory pathway component GspD/PulD (secretin)
MKHILIILLLSLCLSVNAEYALDSIVRSDSSTSPIIAENSNLHQRSPITLTAKDASLSEILRVMADRSGMNFVAGEGVHREKITLILNKTPVDEAINLLVRAAGLSYEIIGNSVLIAEPEKLKEEVGLSSYVIELKYAQADEVAVMLKDLTKNVQVDKDGNRIICYTSPRVILEIERIVKSIDHPHILVLLETRLIEVSMDKLDQYGINWANLSPISSGISFPESKLTSGYKAEDWLKLPVDFNVNLDMLIQNGDAKMLMNSKLTTTNNREATLHIGEIVPYTIQSYNMGTAGGSGGNLQILKENVGVIITITPHVNEERQITLNLAPEVSNIVGWKGQYSDIPMVRVRKTNTTVRVENGQKIFLAGLLSEDKSVELHRVPVLGYIPLLGLIFQHKKEIVNRKNLIIEVIPRIVNNPSEIAKILESGNELLSTSQLKPDSTSSGKAQPPAAKESGAILSNSKAVR